MARASVVVAAAQRSRRVRGPLAVELRPVDRAKLISPSNGVWAGKIAKAIPSCAATARRLASLRAKAQSVAMITSVVFSPGRAPDLVVIRPASGGIGKG